MRKHYILLFSILVLFLMPFTARAQSSLLFTVSPARQQIVANPGEVFPVSVTFYNRTESPVTGLIKTSDFIVEDEKGTPTFIDPSLTLPTKYSAAQWIALPYERIDIGTNNKAVVIATVSIPTDVKPGGRYAAIYFEPVSKSQSNDEAGASITPRIASLIYIRVAGPIVENAFISGMSAKSFSEYGPIDIEARIMNKGDYHIRPKGTFTLTNIFGETSNTSSLTGANIFPESNYLYKSSIGQKWMMGKYTLSLNAVYGSRDSMLTHSVIVWVFPWRVVVVVTLSTLILLTVVKFGYDRFIKTESMLQSQLSKEKEEIEKLKKQLENK